MIGTARIALATLFLVSCGYVVLPAGARQQQPAPQTWQETRTFGSGPTPFEPLMKFWYELDAMSDLVSIRPLTKTLLDREFTLVTIAKDPVTSPQDAIRSGKTIVLIANAVHGNETAGKEASQLGDNDITSLTPEQREQMQQRAEAQMKQRQRVPMMRLVKEQPKQLLEVNRYTDLNRTRYSQPW